MFRQQRHMIILLLSSTHRPFYTPAGVVTPLGFATVPFPANLSRFPPLFKENLVSSLAWFRYNESLSFHSPFVVCLLV